MVLIIESTGPQICWSGGEGLTAIIENNLRKGLVMVAAFVLI